MLEPTQSHAVNYGEWRMWRSPNGRDGACMSAGGNTGSFDEVWALTEDACAAMCNKRQGCIAYEFARLDGGRSYTRCGTRLSAMFRKPIPSMKHLSLGII